MRNFLIILVIVNLIAIWAVYKCPVECYLFGHNYYTVQFADSETLKTIRECSNCDHKTEHYELLPESTKGDLYNTAHIPHSVRIENKGTAKFESSTKLLEKYNN